MYRQKIVAGSCNSGTSSETSESQSIEDSTACSADAPASDTTHINRSARASKNWDRMKDSHVEMDAAESKRPPWRAVSVSTLPKPDKSAILRAKLLDASRRLRAGKVAIAIQTDLAPTKLMREVSLGVQADLKNHKDVGVLTDGSYVIMKKSSGDYILTFSVSQMTDSIALKNASTQTLLPKVSGDAFLEAYRACYNNGQVVVPEVSDLSSIEQELLHQIRAIRSSKRHNTQTSSKDIDDASHDAKVMSPENTAQIRNCPKSLPPAPTYSSWHFDFEDEREGAEHFQPYKIMRARSHFSRVGGANRGVQNTQQYRAINMKAFAINAIDELILESNNLVDCIEDLSARNEVQRKALPDAEMMRHATFKSTMPIFPSDYWLPIIEKEEKDLCDKMSNLKELNVRKWNKFDLTENKKNDTTVLFK